MLGDPDAPGQTALPGANKEAGRVAALLHARALIGKDASKELLYHLEGKIDLLHIAAHGIYDPAGHTLFSTIYLAGSENRSGRLTVDEIQSDLDLWGVNLVILAICQSGLGRYSGGDDVVNLTRAFLYAGSPGVISALWNIDDQGTALLIEKFYERFLTGSTAADALRQAQLAMLRDTEYRDPHFWAGFFLTGDPRGGLAGRRRIPIARVRVYFCMRRTVICAILLLLSRGAMAQQYYGIPIEDGGVAFLLDTSGSMDNRSELKEAVRSILAGIAEAVKDTPLGESEIARRLRQNPNGTPPKMEAARTELMHALDSLRAGTNFTIITFGLNATEWPGGVRTAGPAAKSLAREYVASLSGQGPTPMAEALELGFQAPNVRTLFVVSDGRPTTASVLDLVVRLQESREGRHMVIHTVGIGSDQDGALLCQLALDNEGIYVRDGAVACTFSPCRADDGVITYYPASSTQKSPSTTPICSSAEHPECTPKLVYDTMLSEARFQTPTRERKKLANCLELEPPPVTIVLDEKGLEATTYTRPGHPSHPTKIRRIVKQQGDDVVVETTGAGKGGLRAFNGVDKDLIDAVQLEFPPPPRKEYDDEYWKKDD